MVEKKISRLSQIVLLLLLSSAFLFAFGIVRPAAAQPQATVDDVRWEPAGAVNDKVYQGAVSFQVSGDPAGVKSIYVKWIPVKYDQLSEKAFPKEAEKDVQVKPSDGIQQGSVEKFSCPITDIVGGREYDVKVVVEDNAGGVSEKTVRTPYIRQFENVAKNDDLLIGTYYYPWYSAKGSHWNSGYTGSPSLGEYDSKDPIVISKHIDWASGHGIDYFMVSWWGPGSDSDVVLKDYIMKNPLAGQMKFAIFYETTGRLKGTDSGTASYRYDLDGKGNKEKLSKDFDYISSQYFGSPDYLKLDGKPVVNLYLARIFRGDVKGDMDGLRKTYHVYLMGDFVYWDTPNSADVLNRMKGFDGVTAYSMYGNQPSTIANFESNVDQKYREWSLAANNAKVDFIPVAMPGYDDRAVKNRNNLPLQRSVDRFKGQVGIAKKYMGDRRMYLISTFNEWHEYTTIEPSEEYGFAYLEAVK